MPLKKLRVDSDEWINNIIYLLLHTDASELHENTLYELTHTTQTEQTESLIFEHPSLHSSPSGMVRFRPFCKIHNQDGLLEMLNGRFPRAYRRIDMRGLYRFVDADLDELIFKNKVIVLDTITKAIVAKPENYNENENLKAKWSWHVKVWSSIGNKRPVCSP